MIKLVTASGAVGSPYSGVSPLATQEVAKVSRLVFTDENAEIITSSYKYRPGHQYEISSAQGHDIEVIVDGLQTPAAPVSAAWVPATSMAMPAMNTEQLVSIITALVHQMGGAVNVGGAEVFYAAQNRRLTAYQQKDPYSLMLKTEDL